MKLTGSNLRGYGNIESPTVLGIYGNGYINARTLGPNDTMMYTWFDIQWDFYYSDTGEIASGQWAIEFNDLDTSSKNPEDGNQWHETVQLQQNFGDIHVIPDSMFMPGRYHEDTPGCYLNFIKLSSGYVSCQANPNILYDENTLHTGFMVGVRSGFRMSWWGEAGCATVINKMYGQSKIVAAHDEGGSITHEGTTEVAWKNDKTYTITADKYYDISGITVDGVPIPITAPSTQSYTFSEVTSDHSIHATFKRHRHTIYYDPNTEIYEGTTPSSEHDAGSNILVSENGYSKTGYRFTGWNTMPDGSGTTYVPADTFFLDDEDVALYAQWEPITYCIIYDANGGNGYMVGQEVSYDSEGVIQENGFMRRNCEFVGWNTSPDGTGTSYSPDETFINLTDIPNGNVTLYAQWNPFVLIPATGRNSGVLMAFLIFALVTTSFTGVLLENNKLKKNNRHRKKEGNHVLQHSHQ